MDQLWLEIIAGNGKSVQQGCGTVVKLSLHAQSAVNTNRFDKASRLAGTSTRSARGALVGRCSRHNFAISSWVCFSYFPVRSPGAAFGVGVPSGIPARSPLGALRLVCSAVFFILLGVLCVRLSLPRSKSS